MTKELDKIYIGGILNKIPTQYIKFTNQRIEIKDVLYMRLEPTEERKIAIDRMEKTIATGTTTSSTIFKKASCLVF